MKRIEKSWGYEEIIHADETYTCKKLVYTKPIASSLHYHPNKHETFVVASGSFEVEVYRIDYFGHLFNKVMHIATPGTSIVLAPNTPHRVRFVGPYPKSADGLSKDPDRFLGLQGVIIEASTFDDPEDVVRLIPSEK